MKQLRLAFKICGEIQRVKLACLEWEEGVCFRTSQEKMEWDWFYFQELFQVGTGERLSRWVGFPL